MPGELDTAVQAAAGRSNRQIAADTHLSIRTVQSHLRRAYELQSATAERAAPSSHY
jgi:DNA-binding CsgD family transcriptional regulator